LQFVRIYSALVGNRTDINKGKFVKIRHIEEMYNILWMLLLSSSHFIHISIKFSVLYFYIIYSIDNKNEIIKCRKIEYVKLVPYNYSTQEFWLEFPFPFDETKSSI